MNKYLRIGLALTALTWSNYSPSLAASFPVIRESVIVCDPNAPHNCIIPAADGSIPVTGGGGGGGGAVTIADGADITQGAKADATCGTATGTCTEIQLLKYLNTQLGTPIPAGTNVIGHVITDTGSTTAVTSLPALPSGSNTIGNIGGLETSGSAVTGGLNRVAGKDGSGNAQDIATSTTGVLDSPRAGTANRVVTKTNLSSNTSTTVCPTASAPISTELFFTTAGVGISLAGGTLTTATIGTTASTTPDLSFATANTLYTLPVPPTNIITAYGAAGIVVCIQNIRQ